MVRWDGRRWVTADAFWQTPDPGVDRSLDHNNKENQMNSIINETDSELSPKRLPNGLTPPGCRVLHIPIREDVFRLAKAAALLQAVRFPEYVARLLRDAGPIPGQHGHELQASPGQADRLP